jgi:probable HAF family extracellular repeat protein
MRSIPLFLTLVVVAAGCRDVTEPSRSNPPRVHANLTLSSDVHVVVHDLGTLGGDFSAATAVNDLGQVVGTSTTVTGEEHVFIWTSETGMSDLGILGTPRFAQVNAINNAGDLVGWMWMTVDPGSASHGFRWNPTTGLLDLGALDPQNVDGSSAEDVNAQGTIAGWSSGLPVIWSPTGVPTVLGELQAGMGGGAEAINGVGHVAGTATIISAVGLAEDRAFLWTTGGGMQNLGTLDNGQFSYSDAKDLNDLDQVVGESDSRGFIWSPQTGMTDFQTLTGTDLVPLAINNDGLVVGNDFRGRTSDGIHVRRAFLWTQESGLIGIDPIGFGLVGGEGAPFAEAADINDMGMIVGLSTTETGSFHATVWTLEASTDNRAPVAVSGGPFQGFEGSPVSFDASGSTDPDGDALSCAWDFGDGSSATEVSPTHGYADNGVFQVTLTVTDGTGLSSAVVTSATIANVAPSVDPFAGATILQGESYTGAGAFTDPGADIWTALVDFGDGSGLQPLTLVGNAFTLSHGYGTPGTYLVRVTISDDDGGSGIGQVSVVVQSPQEATGVLLTSLGDLVAVGVLSSGNANALGAKLRAALIQLAAANPAAAANQLRAFINQVNALVSAGRLPLEQGRALVNTVLRVTRAIQLF